MKNKQESLNKEAVFESRQIRKRFLGRCLLLALAVLLVFSFTSLGRDLWKQLFFLSGFGGKTDAPLAIHVLDVGKADAVVIECEGHAALLDAGTAVSGEMIVDYLKRNRIDSLDYVIASHPDKDHIGGMAQVLTEVKVDQFLRSPYFSEKYEELQSVRQEQSIGETTIVSGDSISLGGATLSVLGPLKEYSDTNNASLVIWLEYQGFSTLFCGDIEEEAELDLAEAYGTALSSDLLKVPHHGSKTSCTDLFLSLVSPRYAVVSVGRDNHNLPAEQVLKKLDLVSEELYQTDTDGTVVFTIQENEVKIFTNQ